MYINNELFYFNYLNKNVVTDNYCKRVGIYIQLNLDKEHIVTLPVNPTSLKMLECLEVKLNNRHILDYVIANKKNAFEQIYNKDNVVARYE